jgi:hypothetical protein
MSSPRLATGSATDQHPEAERPLGYDQACPPPDYDTVLGDEPPDYPGPRKTPEPFSIYMGSTKNTSQTVSRIGQALQRLVPGTTVEDVEGRLAEVRLPSGVELGWKEWKDMPESVSSACAIYTTNTAPRAGKVEGRSIVIVAPSHSRDTVHIYTGVTAWPIFGGKDDVGDGRENCRLTFVSSEDFSTQAKQTGPGTLFLCGNPEDGCRTTTLISNAGETEITSYGAQGSVPEFQSGYGV